MKIKIKRKKIINEAAKTIEDLPDGYNIYIVNTAKYDRFMMPARYRIFMSKSFNRNSLKFPYLNSYIDIKKHRSCGEYYVFGVQAKDKFGPLLYDVAMEWTTKQGSGLMADRDNVKQEAYNVWSYYLNKRDDVAKKQMEYDEECTTSSNKYSAGKNHEEWWKSEENPLSKVYTKEANLLNTDKVVEKI